MTRIKAGNELVTNSFLRYLSEDEIKIKVKEEAYLGAIFNDETLFNPLNQIPYIAHDKLSEYLVYLMSRPEYFYFMIKVLFGMRTFPMQGLILKELYERRFPILIGARGLSKCVNKDTIIISDNGIQRISDLNIKDIPYIKQDIGNINLLGENTYNKIEYGFYSGKRKTKIITTRSGRKIECTLNHPIRTVQDGKIDWKHSEFLKIGDFLPIQRDYKQWKNYNDINPDIAYMIGAIIGDGCYSEKSTILGFTNNDADCISNVNIGLKKWKDSSLKLIQFTTRKKIQYIVKGSEFNRFYKDKFIEEFGCEKYSQNTLKSTPKSIMYASFSAIAGYLQGLFDTDGCCHSRSPVVEFSSKSYKLIEETQFLLMVLGINSLLKKQYNKKYNKYYYKLQISGSSLRIFKDKVGFRIRRKQALLESHCTKVVNENIDLIPHDLILDKLLKLRELSRDTVYNSIEDSKKGKNRIKNLSPARLRSYRQSYDSIKYCVAKFAESPTASNSKEFKELIDLISKNYYYDEIVSIEDGETDTYDVHLEGDDHSYISNGFISHNTFTLGLYLMIRMITTPGVKCVITGAGFRQAKLVFEVMENIWEKAPMLRACFKGGKNGWHHNNDAWHFRLGDSICWALPVGHDGQKIRGYRANVLVADEFATLIRNIFEEVMGGFLSVSADSISQIQEKSYQKGMDLLGLQDLIRGEESGIIQNQLILSGTAYHKHNHFYEYFNRWRGIIHSKGDMELISKFYPEAAKNPEFNWKDYSVIRIPVNLIQAGHMDMAQIGRTKASVASDVYAREYDTIFTDDSDGFFKRSLINFCTLSNDNNIVKNGVEIKFNPTLKGSQTKKYVFGVDPAYQGDNFAIVVLEINEGYRGVVHCWTTQASDHKERLKAKLITENDYYHYCARKIRDLMKRFPCAYIALDPQGGGFPIMEALMDTTKMQLGEEMILPVIDPTDKPKETDFMQGDHIIHVMKTSSIDWITEANHSLKKDMESRDIIFPYHDSISYVEADFYDQTIEGNQLYDTLQDCVTEIEELKNELSTITISETATGKQHFDTPELKSSSHKKGRLRKDRYSALLMANYIARNANNLIVRPLNTTDANMEAYFGPNIGKAFIGGGPIAEKLNQLYS